MPANLSRICVWSRCVNDGLHLISVTYGTNHRFDFYILISNATAGDCLAAGFIAAALKGLKQDAAVAAGLQAAISCSTRFSLLHFPP